MQKLQQVSRTPRASWYRIVSDHDSLVERYVVSTQGSREVVNRPELLGMEFNLALHDAMASAFSTAPFRDVIERHPQDAVCVLNFLRGGLNFEIRRALHTAYGFNRHASAFMSSQRFRMDDGRWSVQEDTYRKLDIADDAVIIAGDVVATGVTLENGLRVIWDHMRTKNHQVRSLVFFTIGCHKAEKVLQAIDEEAREHFDGYGRTILVYLEGKFRLVDSKSRLRIGVPGTDLVRHDSLLPPELERSMVRSVPAMLERCVIYDAGSRAFDVNHYLQDVAEYWRQVRDLGEQGWSLRDAVEERWPELEIRDRDEWLRRKGAQWEMVPDEQLSELWSAWSKLHDRRVGATADALVDMAQERLAALQSAGLTQEVRS